MTDRAIVVTADELQALVRQAVREELSRQPANTQTVEWIGPDEVARMTGYARRYVAELVRKHGLPAEKVGRKLRFRRSDVEKWMRERDHG